MPETKTKRAIALPLTEASPVCDGNGITFLPTIVSELYRRTVKEKLFARLFPGNEQNFGLFAQYVAHPQAKLVLCRTEGLLGEETCGYGFLYQQNGVAPEISAMAGFGFFRSFWGSREIVECASKGMDYWFQSGVKVLYATVLRSNPAAGRFITKELGWKEVGLLPSYFYVGGSLKDGIMYSCSRKD